MMELGVELMSLDPSSKVLRLVTRPGGSEPGPEGDGKVRKPGEGARRGGVARPRPESVPNESQNRPRDHKQPQVCKNTGACITQTHIQT